METLLKVKNEIVKDIVSKVVKYVEQKHKDLDSSEKYAQALQKSGRYDASV